jgi:uracil-DNA glycosylase family 4
MPFNPALCAGCPIAGKYSPIEEGEGPDDARFVVVTDVPTRAAARDGRLMGNADKKIFGSAMREVGFVRDDFRFTPMCRCAYDPNDHTTKEKTKIHRHCRVHLLDEIENSSRDGVLPLGANAATATFGKGTKITKVRGTGHRVEGVDAPIFPLMSPTVVRNYPQNAPVFQADAEALARFIEAGGDMARAQAERRTGEYKLVYDLQELLDRDPDAEEVLSFDCETTGLRWYQQGVDVRTYNEAYHKGSAIFKPKFQILTMQFTTRSGESFVLPWDHPEAPMPEADRPRIRNQIRKLLCHPNRIVVGHRVKFDNVALWMVEGIRFRIGGCTNMLLALIDENAMEKNLDIATKIYVPEMAGYADHFNRIVDKSRMWEVPLDQLAEYGGGDTDAAWRLYNVLEEQVLTDQKLWAHYVNVSIPGLNAFCNMEVEGLYTDTTHALPEFRATMQRVVEENRVSLLNALPRELKRALVNEYRAQVDPKTGKPDKKKAQERPENILSFSRPEFLREILFTHRLGFKLKPKVFTKTTGNLNDKNLRAPSTSSKDHLPYFFDTCPYTEQLATYLKESRLLGTNVIRFEENYIVNGRVRPTYQLADTVTGRTNSQDPNGQNYPKRGERAKVYRRMFTAPPAGWSIYDSPYRFLAAENDEEDEDDWIVIEADLSQAELRIAASYANEPTMLGIYRNHGDIHTATAKIVLGVTDAQWDLLDKATKKDARTKAKAVNFGFLYGMGWRKFIGYAKTQYNVEFTESEAQRVRENFFKKYAKLPAWHKAVRDFARKHKYVRSYSGRIRHLPMIDSAEEYIQQEAERQAINSPVQEFGSSLGVMTLGRMNDEINPRYLRMVGFIHDAIVLYTRRKHLDWAMRTIKGYMESNPVEEWFGHRIKCPIVADVSFGENLGQVYECEGFALDQPFDYDAVLRDKDGNLAFELPEQEVPSNNGRIDRPTFTTLEDLEDEAVAVAATVRRIIRGVATQATLKRIARSTKQMAINRRNREKREEHNKTVRRIMRRALSS